MKQLVEKFQARGSDGAIYTVHIYQKMTEFNPLSGPGARVGGTKDARLSDGRHLNWIDDTFQILDNDQIIRRA
ncbi:hypothetical protein ACVI1L_004445 [Bradyrhizobium sp. USDA 4516]